MIEPKVMEFSEGEYVLHSDYARLKAEVERIGAENSHLHKGIYSLSLNVGQLKDEVERLTKAEDKMIEVTYIKGVAGVDRNGGQP